MSIVNIEALKNLGAVLYWPGQYASSGVYSETGDKRGFVILPADVSVTPSGTFTSIKGKDGRNYLKFDGSTNYISLTATTPIQTFFAGDFTIGMWVNFSFVAANRMLMLQLTDASNWWEIIWLTSNTLEFNGKVSNVAAFDYTIPFTPVAGIWYYVVITKSGSGVNIYLNAISQAVTIATAWSAAPALTSDIKIGNGSTTYHAGSIKDVMLIKGRALSQDQIAAIMQETFIY